MRHQPSRTVDKQLDTHGLSPHLSSIEKLHSAAISHSGWRALYGCVQDSIQSAGGQGGTHLLTHIVDGLNGPSNIETTEGGNE